MKRFIVVLILVAVLIFVLRKKKTQGLDHPTGSFPKGDTGFPVKDRIFVKEVDWKTGRVDFSINGSDFWIVKGTGQLSFPVGELGVVAGTVGNSVVVTLSVGKSGVKDTRIINFESGLIK